MPKKIDRVISYVAGEANTMVSTEVMVDYTETETKDEVVKISKDVAVTVQVGPTKGDAYAVFSKNPAFHDGEPSAWFPAARMALELWSARKNYAIRTLMPEHGRPLNMKMEYVV